MRSISGLVLLSAAALALSACSSGDEVTPEADASASGSAGVATTGLPVGSGTREAVYAAQSEGPEPFVRALYAQYVAGGPKGEQPAPGQEPLYSRTLNALIGADFRAANGEVPNLNYDPICGCQDQGVFTLDSMAVAQADVNTAQATVLFTNAGEQKDATLKLVREGVNWKVDDIAFGTEESLHDMLMKVAEAAG
ncbi:YbjP/YqhG family protein [Brevundimonas subvibrioides]|uniref:DUF3828 domain-containing protein n=1 Tax=Brevundimonas subvibrioides (strain ATCC 15264 / DSM 4735 / LMG 14903 / NBRC 16000 / CB 81) TaxID=633149 RepID=D9QJI7_BRESC|nr:YbjP/YqhG family protein [Brevundimonas subvibrioides]ADL01548.1 hypothetical protein Bresu_2238 [Brevundimonas subvibrioides ATCC 15264]